MSFTHPQILRRLTILWKFAATWGDNLQTLCYSSVCAHLHSRSILVRIVIRAIQINTNPQDSNLTRTIVILDDLVGRDLRFSGLMYQRREDKRPKLHMNCIFLFRYTC